jgi:hypothetical protein
MDGKFEKKIAGDVKRGAEFEIRTKSGFDLIQSINMSAEELTACGLRVRLRL